MLLIEAIAVPKITNKRKERTKPEKSKCTEKERLRALNEARSNGHPISGDCAVKSEKSEAGLLQNVAKVASTSGLRQSSDRR
jgi:hypothetical protein